MCQRFNGALAQDLGLLVLRVGASGMMCVHGLDKWMHFESTAAEFEKIRPAGLPGGLAAAMAIASELGCALLTAAGLKSRWAASPLVFTMCVAAFQVQSAGGFFDMELALLYALVFATLVLTGAGRFSLDMLWGSKR